jgi:protein-S-isoprenylcysteine O-methyltransferase
MTAAALALLVFDLALLEHVLRRGRGRSFAMAPSDRGTTWLTSLAPLLLIGGAWPARAALAAGRAELGAAGAAAALGVMLAGSALRVWAMRTLGEFFSRTLVTFRDQAVVDRGPYRWLRHPGYLARMLVVLPGILVLSSNGLYTAVATALYLEIYRRRTSAEEAMLLARFGEAYAAYRARTWRLIPFAW